MVENPGRDVRKVSWGEYQQNIDNIALIIKKKYPKLKYIYGLPRGGLPIAVSLSHKLGIPLISGADGLGFGNSEILIVDDICDSGETLDELFEEIIFTYPVYTMFVRDKSEVIEFYSEKIKDEWIMFPWEV